MILGQLGVTSVASGSRFTAGGSMNPYNPYTPPPNMLPWLPPRIDRTPPTVIPPPTGCPPGTVDAGGGQCYTPAIDCPCGGDGQGGCTPCGATPGSGPVGSGIPFTYLIVGGVLLFLVLR